MARPSDNLDPLLVAEEWKSEGRGVAIATVVETWGSAPRPAVPGCVSGLLASLHTPRH